MKLIVAIVHDSDAGKLSKALVRGEYRTTQLNTTGGFLKEGNTTFLIGVDDVRVGDVMEIIKENCQTRDRLVSPLNPIAALAFASYPAQPVKVSVGGYTVFVLDVEEFQKSLD